MKMSVTKIDESYVAGKFERLYEEKVASFLKKQGIELVKIVKFGHDENGSKCELKYDVHVKETSREKDRLLENKLGLEYVVTDEDEDIYTMSFSWNMKDTKSMELLYGRLTTDFGIENNVDLYKNTMERLKHGICWGTFEEVVSE